MVLVTASPFLFMTLADAPTDMLGAARHDAAEGRCAFHCLGCSGGSSPAHEAEALVPHVRLLLREVVILRQQVAASPRLLAPAILRRTSGSVSGGQRSWPWPGSAPALPPDPFAKDPSDCDLLRLLDGSLPPVVGDRGGCDPKADNASAEGAGDGGGVAGGGTGGGCAGLASAATAASASEFATTAVASDATVAAALAPVAAASARRHSCGAASLVLSPPPPPSPSEGSSPSSPQARCSLLFGDAEGSLAGGHDEGPLSNTYAAKTLLMGSGGAGGDVGGSGKARSAAAIVDETEGAQEGVPAAGGVAPTDPGEIKGVATLRSPRAGGGTAASAEKGDAEADAYRTLSTVTADLQSGKLPHAEAAEKFTALIGELPPGKLRSSALLNRAHCLVGLGRYSAALLDIDKCLEERVPGFDPRKWHKVWLSRGSINRKLAQSADRGGVIGLGAEAECGGDGGHGASAPGANVAAAAAATLYTKARADYEHVLSIDPPHAGYAEKARRCLELLPPAFRPTGIGVDASGGGGSGGGVCASSGCGPGGGGGCGGSAFSGGGCAAAVTASAGAKGRGCDGVTADDATNGAAIEGGAGGAVEAAPPTSPPAQDSPSGLAKRRRLRLPSRESLARASARGIAAGQDVVASSAAAAVSSDVCSVDAAFAQRALRALGRDCAVAGLSLFRDGAVRERNDRVAAVTDSTRRTAADGVVDSSRAAPVGDAFCGVPRRRHRRVFEIRTPWDGPVETVILECGLGPSASSGASDRGARTSKAFETKVGECSCRLRAHCKHVAAALCAVEREEQHRENGSMVSAAVSVALPGAATSRSERDAVERRLEKRTIEELKHCLRLNNQLVGGTKAELLRRVADGLVYGALPVCPQCGGHLHAEAGGRFRCKKLNRDREPCGFEAEGSELERRSFKGADQLL